MTDLISDLRVLVDSLDEHARLGEDSGTMYGAGEASICRVTRRGLLRILDEHEAAKASRSRREQICDRFVTAYWAIALTFAAVLLCVAAVGITLELTQ